LRGSRFDYFSGGGVLSVALMMFFGRNELGEMTTHDAFGTKSFAAMKFSGGIASACSEMGHGHGFFDTNRTDWTEIRRRRLELSLTKNLKPGV
jgi:hypothetical protein